MPVCSARNDVVGGSNPPQKFRARTCNSQITEWRRLLLNNGVRKLLFCHFIPYFNWLSSIVVVGSAFCATAVRLSLLNALYTSFNIVFYLTAALYRNLTTPNLPLSIWSISIILRLRNQDVVSRFCSFFSLFWISSNMWKWKFTVFLSFI